MYPFIRPIRRLLPTSRETGVSMLRSFGANVEASRIVIKTYVGELLTLPHRRGILTLTLNGLPAIADGTLPVYVSDNRITKPLLLPTGDIMPASELQSGEHITFCYDKPAGTIHVTSSEALPTTSATPSAGEAAGEAGA